MHISTVYNGLVCLNGVFFVIVVELTCPSLCSQSITDFVDSFQPKGLLLLLSFTCFCGVFVVGVFGFVLIGWLVDLGFLLVLFFLFWLLQLLFLLLLVVVSWLVGYKFFIW